MSFSKDDIQLTQHLYIVFQKTFLQTKITSSKGVFQNPILKLTSIETSFAQKPKKQKRSIFSANLAKLITLFNEIRGGQNGISTCEVFISPFSSRTKFSPSLPYSRPHHYIFGLEWSKFSLVYNNVADNCSMQETPYAWEDLLHYFLSISHYHTIKSSPHGHSWDLYRNDLAQHVLMSPTMAT